MVNLFIATNEEQIRFGNKEYISNRLPWSTRYCVENVSEDLYEALMQVASMPEYKTAVANILYYILDKKSLSNN